MLNNYQQEILNNISNNENYNNNNYSENLNHNRKTNANTYSTNNHRKNLAELKDNYSLGNNTKISTNNDNINNFIANYRIVDIPNTNEINQSAIISNNKNNNNIVHSPLAFKSREAAESNQMLQMMNDDTIQILNNQTLNKNNLLLNSNNSNTNSRDERQTAVKSSALRALLDEMKTKNAYNLNENNSENLIFNNTNSKNNMTARTTTDNRNADLSLLATANQINLKSHHHGSAISQTARTNNLMTKDFLDTNTNKQQHNYNTSGGNYISDNAAIYSSNDNSLGRMRNFSVDSGANSNAADDLNFDEMKNEIDNLQCKIDGLEKKLRIYKNFIYLTKYLKCCFFQLKNTIVFVIINICLS